MRGREAPGPLSPAASPAPATAPAEQRAALLVTCLASFLTPFMGSALNLAIPDIGRELRVSAVSLNWIVSAYLLSSAAFLLPFGRLADLRGRRRVFVTGALVQALVSVALALAGSAKTLVTLRFLQGVGGAMLVATGLPILINVFPPSRRGRVLGINTASVYAGLSLGPVVGGFLTKQFGWRSIFAVNAAASLLVAIATVLYIKQEQSGSDRKGFDRVGAVLYATGLAALLGGISALRSVGGAGWLLVAGVIGLFGFLARESSCREPLVEIRLFRNPPFALSNLAALIHYSATFAVGFLLSLYLQTVRGIDPRVAGLILLAQPVFMALLSPFAGRLSDRIAPQRLASSGMALTLLGLAVFATLDRGTPLQRVVGGLILIGVGFGLFSAPNTNAVMSAVIRRDYGVAAATLGTMRAIGQAGSMALVSLVFAQFVGAARIDDATVQPLLTAMRTTFALFSVLSAIGTAASLARGRSRD